METAAPTSCNTLKQKYDQEKEFLSELEDELRHTTNPQEKSRLLYLIRSARQALAQASAALQLCLHPPPPLPNLVPTNFTIRRHPDGKAFDFALQVSNAGTGGAHGPFQVTLGVDYYTYGQDPPLQVYRELNVNVPASAAIPSGGSLTTDYWPNIPILHRPGTIMASYNFYALVDAQKQVGETNEADNSLHKTLVL